MHEFVRLTVFCTAAALATAIAAAQTPTPSVLAPAGTYHFGEIGTSVPTPLNPGPGSISGSRGTLTLRPDLTMSVAMTYHEVFSTGAIVSGTATDTGAYRVTPDARMVLDFDPANPGSDEIEGFLDPAAESFVFTRVQADHESFLIVALASSTGQSNASLSGAYHLVDTFWDLSGGNLSTGSVRGTIVFDGAGTATVSGNEQTITGLGTVSNRTVTGSVPYAVAPDGSVTFATQRGAISPSGDMLFLLTIDPGTTEVILTLAVRTGPALSLLELEGTWGVAVHEIELRAPAASNPLIFTDFIALEIDATSPTTGTYSFDERCVENDPTGVTAGTNTGAGVINLLPGGIGQLVDPVEGVIAELLFQDAGQAFITTAQQGLNDVIVGVKTCGKSAAYGTQTVGTGGVAPELGLRGFPVAGDPNFALRIVGGRGAASAVLPIALGPGPGFPFLGGTIWFDPGLVLASAPLTLGGAAGAAGAGEAVLPLFVSTTSTIIDVPIHSQALVLDPAAPGGISMSGGLRFVFCR